MTDLTLVTKIAAGGIASLFIVMISLSLTTWIMGMVARRIVKRHVGSRPEEELEA